MNDLAVDEKEGRSREMCAGKREELDESIFLIFRIESRDGCSWLSRSGMNFSLEMENTPVGDFFLVCKG